MADWEDVPKTCTHTSPSWLRLSALALNSCILCSTSIWSCLLRTSGPSEVYKSLLLYGYHFQKPQLLDRSCFFKPKLSYVPYFYKPVFLSESHYYHLQDSQSRFCFYKHSNLSFYKTHLLSESHPLMDATYGCFFSFQGSCLYNPLFLFKFHLYKPLLPFGSCSYPFKLGFWLDFTTYEDLQAPASNLLTMISPKDLKEGSPNISPKFKGQCDCRK